MSKFYSVPLSVEELKTIADALHLMQSVQESQTLNGVSNQVNPVVGYTFVKISSKLSDIDLDQELLS